LVVAPSFFQQASFFCFDKASLPYLIDRDD